MAEGSIGKGTDAFMAGTTQYRTKQRDHDGAWYARRLTESVAAGELPVSGGLSAGSPGTKTDSATELSVSGGLIATKNMIVVQTCRLTGGVSGLTQYVKSVWLQPISSSNDPVELPIDSGGRFVANALPVGSYQFGLVPYGKLDLLGPGVSQQINCTAGGMVRVSAEVNSISD